MKILCRREVTCARAKLEHQRGTCIGRRSVVDTRIILGTVWQSLNIGRVVLVARGAFASRRSLSDGILGVSLGASLSLRLLWRYRLPAELATPMTHLNPHHSPRKLPFYLVPPPVIGGSLATHFTRLLACLLTHLLGVTSLLQFTAVYTRQQRLTWLSQFSRLFDLHKLAGKLIMDWFCSNKILTIY